MPKHQTIRVAKGDFDKRFVRIEQDGARNRSLNERKLRSIAANWPGASMDTVTLIHREDDNTFLIADGQHRIAAASKYFDKPKQLNAMVWEENEVGDVAEFIAAFNRGTPFSASNMLEVFQERSPWLRIAKERGLSDELVLRRFRGTKFSWVSLMRSVASADRWRDNERLSSHSFSRDDLLYVWLNYSEQGIHEVLDALEWWKPVADAGYRSIHQNGQLYGDIPFAVALSLYRKYGRDRKFLTDIRRRFGASPQIGALKQMSANNVRWYTSAMLAGFNYRVMTNKAELYGETGRD